MSVDATSPLSKLTTENVESKTIQIATDTVIVMESVFEYDMKYDARGDNKNFMESYAKKHQVVHGKPWFTAKHVLLEMYLSSRFVLHSIVVAYPVDDFVTDGFVSADNMNCVMIKPLSFIKPPASRKFHLTSRCHENVHMIMKDKPIDFTVDRMRVYSGVALSRDRLWRMHSWMVQEEESKTTSSTAAVLASTATIITAQKVKHVVPSTAVSALSSLSSSSSSSLSSSVSHIVSNLNALETTESRLLYYGRPCWCRKCSFVPMSKCYNCPETTGTLLCELCGDNPHCDCCGIPCKTCRSEMCLSCLKTHVCQVTE